MQQIQQNQIMPLHNVGDKTNLIYSQVAHLITSNYDVTIIFYQIEPQKEGDETLSYKPCQREVARIVMPKDAAKELSIALSGIITADPLPNTKEEKKKK